MTVERIFDNESDENDEEDKAQDAYSDGFSDDSSNVSVPVVISVKGKKEKKGVKTTFSELHDKKNVKYWKKWFRLFVLNRDNRF